MFTLCLKREYCADNAPGGKILEFDFDLVYYRCMY